jgi:hypothetical protein
MQSSKGSNLIMKLFNIIETYTRNFFIKAEDEDEAIELYHENRDNIVENGDAELNLIDGIDIDLVEDTAEEEDE